MNDDAAVRRAFSKAEEGGHADVSDLLDATPALLREAGRRRAAGAAAPPSLASLASRALPRVAVLTAVAVAAAAVFVVWERVGATVTPTTLESAVLGEEPSGTGDVLLDALLSAERGDG